MKKIFKALFFPIVTVLLIGGCSVSEEEMGKLTGDGKDCKPISEFLDFQKPGSIRKITIDDNGVPKGIITWINDKIVNVVKSASLKIWLKLTLNVDFRFLIVMMITVSVILFTASVLLGITQASGYNMAMYIFKLVIIYNLAVNYVYFNIYVIQSFEALISDVLVATAFVFSDYAGPNASMMCLGVFGGVICSVNDLIAGIFQFDIIGSILNGGPADKIYLFTAMDDTLSQMFDFRLWKLILTLSATGATGIFWSAMIFFMIVAYVIATVIAIKTYLMAYIARWALYGLGPIFISLALFNQTRSLFDGWLQQIINFTLQPIFLFVFLGMFQSMISGFMSQLYLAVGNGAEVTYKPTCSLANGSCDSTKFPDIEECKYGVDRDCDKCRNTLVNGQCPDDTGDRAVAATPVKLTTKGMCIKYTNKFNKAGSNSLKWFKLCADGGNNCDDSLKPIIPVDIWMVISTLVICYIMAAMCHWVTNVAAQLSSGMVSLSDVRIIGWDKLTREIRGGINRAIGSAIHSKGGGDGGARPNLPK